MKITKSIYWLAGGPFATPGNVWGIRHKNGIILVDAGYHNTETVINRTLCEDGLEGVPVTHVLLTHAHADHVGSAWYYRENTAKIICGEEDVPMLNNGGFLKPVPFIRNYMDLSFTPCQVDISLHGDTELDLDGCHFSCLHMPGHTLGSRVYVFREDDKDIYFTGDLVTCENADGDSMHIWSGDPSYNKEQAINSLERLYNSKVDILLGGHGIPRLFDTALPLENAYRAILLSR